MIVSRPPRMVVGCLIPLIGPATILTLVGHGDGPDAPLVRRRDPYDRLGRSLAGLVAARYDQAAFTLPCSVLAPFQGRIWLR